MPIFIPINYQELNAKQKEAYNFQKVSALLADFGYLTIKLSDDWNGADFIMKHINEGTFYAIQLKGRLTFDKKYIGKDLYICFRHTDGRWFLYPHDELKAIFEENSNIFNTVSWVEGTYTSSGLSKSQLEILRNYQIAENPL